MSYPLTLHALFERAERVFPKKEIVSRTANGLFRYTYADYGRRTRALADALQQLGVQKGDKVGTLAWNHHRHLEAYFAIPCLGAVLHTINIRLSAEHIAYIINHAEDRVLLIDEDLVPLIERVQDQLQTVQAYVILTDRSELPETSLAPVYSYEQLVAQGNAAFSFPRDIAEDDPAGICYTSATTGNPKGVCYTHRNIYLHSMSLGLADTLAISENDTCLPVVPMFHVNAWGFPFASVWFGSKQVLPGPAPTPKALAELIAGEQVTLAAGVPTIWLGLARELETTPYDLSSVRAIVCGGSAAPLGLIRTYEQKYGIPLLHAYGMTEASPVVSVSRLKSYQQELPDDAKFEIRAKQGLVVPGLEARIVQQDGRDVVWNGQEMGELWLRGPWIVESYIKDERTRETFIDGWYHSGDVAVIDEEGTIKLVDRTKDLVKSGGEWISSVDLENVLMAHPAVFEACVVGVPHPKWDERPLAFVVLTESQRGQVEKREILQFVREKVAKWWVPDDVLFLDEIPKTSVGKFSKKTLRALYGAYFTAQEEVPAAEDV